MATITASLLVCVYFVFSPAHWLKKLMKLTPISLDFKLTIIILATTYLLAGWMFEQHIAKTVVAAFANLKQRITRRPKQRKSYKVILEKMRM